MGVAGGLTELSAKGRDDLLADSLGLSVALIPFFALKELGRVLGEEKVWTFFFRRNIEH